MIITPAPNWTYDENCLHCTRRYITEYRYDTGYCSDECERHEERREDL